jgi:hypothetical protein
LLKRPPHNFSTTPSLVIKITFPCTPHLITISFYAQLATYQKISSYGTSAFPKLTYPEDTPAELIYVIEKLLVPVPEMRLGAGPKGYVGVKQTFEGIDWETFHTDPPVSPLAAAASVILDDMAHLGVEPKVLAVFSEEHSGDEWSKTVHF